MTEEKELVFLYVLARLGALRSLVEIKSRQLGELLGTSQQTASRRLIRLEKKGWITRQVFGKNQKIAMTGTGRDKLLELYVDLKRIFGSFEGSQEIHGELVSGLGEGAYYMGQPEYKNQFKIKLGYEPFPGTFNLQLDDINSELMNQLFTSRENVQIDGFQTGGRTFGPVACIRGKINGNDCAILRIERTHHEKRLIEVIAPENLRQKFKASDGMPFEILVE